MLIVYLQVITKKEITLRIKNINIKLNSQSKVIKASFLQSRLVSALQAHQSGIKNKEREKI
jgi:hypothetical protein